MALTGSAYAQPPSAPPAPSQPSAADKETARALFQAGDDYYRAGNYQRALESFRAADDLVHVPTTGLERGRAEAAVGQLIEARETLLRVTRMVVTPGNTVFADAVTEAAQLAEAIAPRIPSLTVVVTGLGDGAEPAVHVDSVALLGTSWRQPRRVNPGEHTVTVAVPGHEPTQRKVTVVEGEHASVEVALESLALAAPPPAPPREPPPEPIPPLERVPVWGWVGFGVGTAGVVVGAVAGAATLSNVADLDERCPEQRCTAAEQADLDSAETISHVSTAGLVVGAAGLGAGFLSLFVGDEPVIGATPWLAPNGAGVRGRF